MRARTTSVFAQSHDAAGTARTPVELIVEEPMTIRLDGVDIATTMRTPGDDFDLAAGFCHAEGVLGGAPVQRIRYCATGSAVDTRFNVVSVETGGRAPEPRPRLGTTTSACGLCGAEAIEALCDRLSPLVDPPRFAADLLAAMPERLRPYQKLFDVTGALHGAAAFDATGEIVVAREDVGRHNAVDKVVGHLLLQGALPATSLGLCVSGRASFEMVQKAWAAGFGAVVAVSAPTALAVETARVADLQLAAFARGDRVTVYSPAPG